jgi:hypothetical protein
MARKTFRVFDESDNFVAWISREEAMDRIRSGAWEDVYHFEAASRQFIGIRRIDATRGSNSPSPTAITARESLANVGIWDGKSVAEGGEVPTGKLHAAQAKIFFYPFEGDDKAVRASCLARA